jgi:L-lactate dehydrogenase complex protein LldG
MTTTPKHEVSLEAFLAPISKALGHTAIAKPEEDLDVAAIIPPHTTDGLDADALVERFKTEASAIRVFVHPCTKDTLADELSKVVAELGGGSVLAANDERMKSMGIEDALNKTVGVDKVELWDATIGREACLEQGDKAAAGITFAEAAIAETATIMQTANARCGRAVSLLPAVHIAVVDAKDIVPSMLDVLKRFDTREGLPSQIIFISGPSMTSDIELVRVEGVHGPTALHYMLVEG